MRKFFFALLLFHWLCLKVPTGWAANVVLGVVRSSDNANEWNEIIQRLETAGIDYRVIELQQVNRASDLAGTTLLFLPNLETLNDTQVLALEGWMSQGGRVIVSGALGSRSSPSVQQSLRSLLGAYWAFPLPQAEVVRPLEICTGDWKNAPIGSKPCDTWVAPELSSNPIAGGVLMPSDLVSQTAATWACSNPQTCENTTSPAVVTNERATFFGWQWGNRTGTSLEFDTAWLQATLSHYGQLPTPSSRPPIARRPEVPASNTQSASPNIRIERIERAEPPQTQPRPPVPARSENPDKPAQSTDPADQVAPAELEVKPGEIPITGPQAQAMRQELADLIGRVESALLLANTANVSINLTAAQEIEAINTGTKAATPSTSSLSAADKAITEARSFLDIFPQLLAQQNFGEARRQWIAARRNLWDHYPTDRPAAPAEIRAVWLDRGTIVKAGSEQGLAQVFDRLAAAGFNTVFFETVNAGYPIYPSQVAPEQNPMTKRWDPLAAAVKLAHERGMELHAWIWTFAAGNERHNPLVNKPADYPGPLIAAHPDWANYDHRGKMIPAGQTKPFLDPANPEVRSYLLRLIDEIVSRYEVDGLQLDYIRYPFQDPAAGSSYGYGKAARALFKQQTGVDPVDISPAKGELWQQWTAFRIQQVDTFVAEASRLVHRLRPNAVVSVAVFPLPRNERLHKIQQNWEEWARQGYVDMVVPMTYSRDTNGLQQLAQPWLTLAANANRGMPALGTSLIVPAIRLLNLPEVVAIDQIQALRDLPASGYALFAAENLSSRLQDIFSQTQNAVGVNASDSVISPQVTPLPYRQPFLTAVTRFDTLQKQWSFLLAQNQLQMSSTQLAAFRADAQTLATNLAQLAGEPNQSRLQAAKRSLNQFQSQFEHWMQSHAQQNPYQVQTWKNHLQTLELLLRYGERVVEVR
jgi:uncharacterized lipoprotein YddW (UPF0748 family)